ncbi:MAG: FecR domain-containing protein [bacterium]
MPDIPDKLDEELLDRYLAGECSESEVVTVRRYLMAHPKDAQAIRLLLERLDGVSDSAAAPDATASWQHMRERMRSESGARVTPTHEIPRQHVRRNALASSGRARRRSWQAAMLVGFAAAATWVFVANRNAQPVTAPVAPTRRTYSTVRGQRAEVRLADGTKVRMAPASRLSIASDYGTDRRDVYLEGEAYFDVLHDVHKPFTVFAGNASARDLGTEFAVRNYSEDGAVQIVVRSGQVALSGLGRLGPGDVGRLASDGQTSLRHHANVERMLGWLGGTLSYSDAPLHRVLEDLRRWYEVDVVIADSSLASLPFTGRIAEASPTAAVQLVAATLGLRARREANRIVLVADASRTNRNRLP